MKSEAPGDPERERRLDEVVTAYFKAVEAGEHLEQGRWLERYPDLAEELQAFFAAQAQIEGMAGPLPLSNTSETVGLEAEARAGTLGTVRYVGDYELLEEIARGGMGVVYKARQVSLNRIVALKMILAGQLASKADVQRFRSEAEAAGQLDHPNIVPIYEVGEHEGQQYFSMKLIEGGSLAAELARFCTRPRAAVGLLAVVARAVHHAHQRGLLHRDLKPSNILLDTNGVPHVADFGLAKKVEGDENATRSGAIVGTPAYMAPEQARAEKALTAAVDVWSLGAILYELLTGRQPFRGEDAVATLMKVVNDEPITLRFLNAQIDKDLETICLKCLDKEPTQRYGSAAALAEELERWLRGEPILARPSGTAERIRKWARRHPAAAAAYSLFLLATLLGTVAGMVTWLWLQAVESRLQAEDARHAADAATAEAVAAREQLANAHQRLQTETIRRQKADAKVIQVTRLAGYAGDVQMAQRQWETFNTVRAEEILDACPNDLRGWEWYHLKDCCRRRAVPLFHGPISAVSSVCFSPDGKQLVTGGGTGDYKPELKVWDVASGKELRTLQGHTNWVRSVCYSPDGKRLVSASADQTVRVWDAANGQEIVALKGHGGPVTSVCFSPDGKRLASASYDKTIKVWDTDNGKELLSLKGHTHIVARVCFSPDGKRLASASDDKTIKVWDAATGGELLSLPGQIWVRCVCFSPDGTRLASAGGGGGSGDEANLKPEVKVWDAATGKALLSLEGHTSMANSVVFSPDGKRLASASNDRTVKVWDAVSGHQLLTLQGHTNIVWGVCFSPDGQRLASAGSESAVRLWNLASGPEVFTLQEGGSGCFSPDGKRLAAAGDDNTVKVWDVASGLALLSLPGHTGTIRRVFFSPDGKRLASAGDDNTVKVWDAATGKQLHSLNGHPSGAVGVCFSPDGKRLASASADKTVKVWDTASGKELLTFKGHTQAVYSVCFSPNGKYLASMCIRGMVKVWDAVDGQELLPLQEAYRVCFSPDGKRLAAACRDQTVKVWDLAGGQKPLTLKGHSRSVYSICFTPDGSRLAFAGGDATAKVWEVADGQEPMTLKTGSGAIYSVCFSPDGKRLVTGGPGKDLFSKLQVWDTAGGQELLTLDGTIGSISNLVFSSDGKRLAADNGRRSAKLWDSADVR